MKQHLFTTILSGSILLLLTTCKSAPPKAMTTFQSYQIECAGAGT